MRGQAKIKGFLAYNSANRALTGLGRVADERARNCATGHYKKGQNGPEGREISALEGQNARYVNLLESRHVTHIIEERKKLREMASSLFGPDHFFLGGLNFGSLGINDLPGKILQVTVLGRNVILLSFLRLKRPLLIDDRTGRIYGYQMVYYPTILTVRAVFYVHFCRVQPKKRATGHCFLLNISVNLASIEANWGGIRS